MGHVLLDTQADWNQRSPAAEAGATRGDFEFLLSPMQSAPGHRRHSVVL